MFGSRADTLVPPPAPERATPGYTRAKAERFRRSQAWRRLRYRILAANANSHADGKARCTLCNRTAAEAGCALHVDHRECVSKCWARRLDPTNLRVLCADCNVGRSNRPLEGVAP